MKIKQRYVIAPMKVRIDGREYGIGGNLVVNGRNIKEATESQYKRIIKPIYPMFFEDENLEIKTIFEEE